MATTEGALFSILSDDATVSGLVGARIYPDVLPQGVLYPALRYQRISTPRAQWRTIDTGRSDYANPRFQVDAWALTRSQALTLGQAVLAALDGFRGTAASLTIQAIGNEDEAGDHEPGIGPNGADVYRQRYDFVIWHPE